MNANFLDYTENQEEEQEYQKKEVKKPTPVKQNKQDYKRSISPARSQE